MPLDTPRLVLRPLTPFDAEGVHACFGDAEAMRSFLRHCFGALDTHRIEALIEPENTASIQLAERLGFHREGLLRDRLLVDGRFRSVAMFRLLEEDWPAGAERPIIRP